MAKDEPKVTDRARCVAAELSTVFIHRVTEAGGVWKLKQAKLDGSLDLDFAKMIQEGMGNGS